MPTLDSIHKHVMVSSLYHEDYSLPSKVKIYADYGETVFDHMKTTKTIDQLFIFLTTLGDRINLGKSICYLDNQTSGESGFFNIQLQMKIQKGKSTIAKAIVDHSLMDITCTDCKKRVLDAFFQAIEDSFHDTLTSRATNTASNTTPLGRSYKVILTGFEEPDISDMEVSY